MTNARHWIHIALSTLALTLAIFAIISINEQPKPKNALQINTALTLYTDSPVLPDESDWFETALPDDWLDDPSSKHFKWYRFTLPNDFGNDDSLALYITNLSRPALVFINGKVLNIQDLPADIMPRIWNNPQFIALHTEFLAEFPVEIILRIPSNQSYFGLLGNIYVGPVAEVKKAYDRAFFIKARLPWLTLFAMLLSGIFMLTLWWLRRKESIYGYYALGAITWTMYSFQYVPFSLPFSAYVWEWIGMNAMFWFPIIVAFFCNCYLQSRQPIAERAVLIVGVMLSSSTLFMDYATFFWVADHILPPAAFILGIYPMGRMLLETFRRKDSRLTWLAILAGALTDLLLLHDVLVLGHWIPSWSGLYFHYAALPLIGVVFTIILLERFVETLSETEQLNITLEARIAGKSAELESNYLRLRVFEREQYLAEERERIMRDMHDGVGGALLSMRAALESQEWNRKEVYHGACEALDDLYLMIHSLDPYGEDLGMALGATRHRFERRLRQADVKLNWRLEEIPPIKGLGPQVVLQVIRIIQEAINNTIKHAGASNLTVHVLSVNTPVTPAKSRIEISDDGKGFPADLLQGHGLENMRQRAAKIGNNFSVSSNGAGTTVRFDLLPSYPTYS